MTTDQPPRWENVETIDGDFYTKDSAIEREEYFCNKLEEIRDYVSGLKILPNVILGIEIRIWNLIEKMRDSR